MKPKQALDKLAGRPNERFLLIALVVVIALAVLHLIWKALPK